MTIPVARSTRMVRSRARRASSSWAETAMRSGTSLAGTPTGHDLREVGGRRAAPFSDSPREQPERGAVVLAQRRRVDDLSLDVAEGGPGANRGQDLHARVEGNAHA